MYISDCTTIVIDVFLECNCMFFVFIRLYVHELTCEVGSYNNFVLHTRLYDNIMYTSILYNNA